MITTLLILLIVLLAVYAASPLLPNTAHGWLGLPKFLLERLKSLRGKQ